MDHEFRMPDIGEGLTEAEIVSWLVEVGDTIAAGQSVVEVETAKTTVEIPATHGGVMRSLGGAPGDIVEVGDVLFVVADQEGEDGGNVEGSIDSDGSTIAPSPEDREPATTSASPPPPSSASIKAMPAVRRLARERGIDLATVTGTGPNGSITREDLDRPQITAAHHDPLSPTRRAIAAHMSESWRTIPHVTVQADVRAERLLARRTTDDGTVVPLEAVVAECVVPLLRRHRWLNATFADGAAVVHDVIDLGFAVDTDAGLMVVVVRDAANLDTGAIGAELVRLAAAARDRSIAPDDVAGQTFTISNVGAVGGGHGTPIIPLGTSAILSIGRAELRPIVENGELAVGLVAPIDLSYDHRLIDGALGQRFLADVVSALES